MRFVKKRELARPRIPKTLEKCRLPSLSALAERSKELENGVEYETVEFTLRAYGRRNDLCH